jgi:hypothetical protein
MDQQLVNQIAQRAGISPDQATQAAQAVVEFLKGRLPGPIASQLDSVLGGQAGAAGGMGNMGNMPSMGNMPNMGNQGNMPNMGGMPGQTNQSLGGMQGQTDQSLGGMQSNQQP